MTTKGIVFGHGKSPTTPPPPSGRATAVSQIDAPPEGMTDAELLDWYVCGRKCRHATERAAKTGAYIAGKGYYRCRVCDGWHVGTTPTRHVRPGRLLKRARAMLGVSAPKSSDETAECHADR